MSAQEKTGAAAGTEGIDYQINMMLITILRSHKLFGDNVSLITEQKRAGKFDDVILSYTDGANGEKHVRLIQIKHKINEAATVTYDDLLIDNNKKLNLKIYFKSFLEIMKVPDIKDHVKDITLFTNLNLNDDLKSFVTELSAPDQILHFGKVKNNGEKPKLLKFKDSFLRELQVCDLKKLALQILQYGFKGLPMKENNNCFSKFHGVLAQEVFDVQNGKFHSAFLKGHTTLHYKTKLLLEIMTEQFEREYFNLYQKKKSFAKVNQVNPEKFKLLFSPKFGTTAHTQWPEDDIEWNDENKAELKKFFNYLILAVNQPNDEELESHLREEIAAQSNNSISNLITTELIHKFRYWFKQKNLKVFTRKDVDGVIRHIKKVINELTTANMNAEYVNKISSSSIQFTSTPFATELSTFLADDFKQLLHVKTPAYQSLLTQLKLIDCLREKDYHNFLLINSDNEYSIGKLIKFFDKSLDYNLLVLESTVCDHIPNSMDELLQVLEEEVDKKVILIGRSSDTMAEDITNRVRVQESLDQTDFGHLTEETRKRILQKPVIFQGTTMLFHQLYPSAIKVDDQFSDFWFELVQNTEVAIGTSLIMTEDYDPNFYINRNIYGMQDARKFQPESFCIRDNSPDILSAVTHKLLIISDTPGMGKSTIFSHLARTIKEQNPMFWVARLKGIDCAKALTVFSDTELNITPAVLDNFLINDLMQLSTQTEKFLFAQILRDTEIPNKLVFLFDGFDEMDTKCRNVVIQILQYLKEKVNVKLLGLTTRPHFKTILQEVLGEMSFELHPFTEQNKIEFLTRYWSSALSLDAAQDASKRRLTEYANGIVNALKISISEKDTAFTGIPLQMRMIAEIFQEEVQSFIASDCDSIDGSKSVDLYTLYEFFVHRKEHIYIRDKSKSVGSSTLENNLILIRKIHTEIAMSILFEDDILLQSENLQFKDQLYEELWVMRENLFRKRPLHEAVYNNNKLLAACIDIGIVQKQDNKFSFIHRTFIEFFVAEYLLRPDTSLLRESCEKKIYYLKSLLTKSDFTVVRSFVNIRIQKKGLSGLLEEFKESAALQRAFSALEYSRIILVTLFEESRELNELALRIFAIQFPSPENQCAALATLIITAFQKFNNTFEFPDFINDWITSRLRHDQKTTRFLISYMINEVFLRNVNQPDQPSEFLEPLIHYQNLLVEEKLLNETELERILLRVEPCAEKKFRSFQFLQKYVENFHRNHQNSNFLFLLIFRSAKFRDLLDHNFLEWLVNSNIFSILLFDFIISEEGKFAKYDLLNLNVFKREELERTFPLLFCVVSSVLPKLDEERLLKTRKCVSALIKQLRFQSLERIIFQWLLRECKAVPILGNLVSDFQCTSPQLSQLQYFVLWSKLSILEIIMESDIQCDDFARLGLEEIPAVDGKVEKILNSIRTDLSATDFQDVLCTRNKFEETILHRALIEKSQVNLRKISSWIETEETFLQLSAISECQTQQLVMGEQCLAQLQMSLLTYVFNEFPQFLGKFLVANCRPYFFAYGGLYDWSGVEDIDISQTLDIMLSNFFSADHLVAILRLRMSISCEGVLFDHFIKQKKTKMMRKLLDLIRMKGVGRQDLIEILNIRNSHKLNCFDLVSKQPESETKLLLRQFIQQQGLRDFPTGTISDVPPKLPLRAPCPSQPARTSGPMPPFPVPDAPKIGQLNINYVIYEMPK